MISPKHRYYTKVYLFLSIFMAFILVFTLLPQTVLASVISGLNSNHNHKLMTMAGSGTRSDPFIIQTPQDLQDINLDLSAYYVLGNDLDMTGYSFTPIGSFTEPFTGVLYGNVHQINNLTINEPDTSGVGLFVCCTGEIDNLAIFNSSVAGYSWVGGLVGSFNGSISNCSFSGVVTASGSDDNYIYDVGGLIGSGGGDVVDSFSEGTINAPSASAVGGLVGAGWGDYDNCYSSCSVYGRRYVGGLIGDNNGDCNDCYSLGSVSGSEYAGGLVGYGWGDYHSCYSLGSVSGSEYVGGLVGNTWGNCFNCFSRCSVSGNGYTGGLIGSAGGFYEGGAFGHLIEYCYSAGIVSGGGDSGGLIGWKSSNYGVAGCFWDSTSSGVDYSAGGTGENTAWMQIGENFTNAGWDFVNTWTRDSSINSGYPYLLSSNHHVPSRSGVFHYAGEQLDWPEIYHYDDAYFAGDSRNYNASLATMSMCLSLSAFASNQEEDYSAKSANVADLLNSAGFSDFATNKLFTVKPTDDSIGVAIANKQLEVNGTDYTLLAVAVRGGGYEKEWASDFTVGETGSHEGFSDAKDQVLAFLRDYLNFNYISGNIKLWITGYSRGAAVANLVAGAIDDEINSGSTLDTLGNCSLAFHDLYAYTFETPKGTTAEDWRTNYQNIFNIVNPSDPVTKVAPEVWGFKQYGTNMIIPSAESKSNYSQLKSQMLEKYNQISSVTEPYSVDDFTMNKISIVLLGPPLAIFDANNHTSQNIFLSELVKSLANDVFENRTNYVTNYQDEIRCCMDLFNGNSEAQWHSFNDIYYDKLKSNAVRLVLTALLDVGPFAGATSSLVEKYTIESMDEAGITSCDQDTLHSIVTTVAANIIGFAMVHSDWAVTLLENYKSIMSAHYPELCLAWLQMMDVKYTPGAAECFTNGDYRVGSFNCPVDVQVYDASGNLVASIISDVPQNISGSSIISSINEDGEKLIYLPANAGYTIKLIPTGPGNMDISIHEFNNDIGDVNRIINYYDIPVDIGGTFTADIPSFSDEDLASELLDGSSTLYSISDPDNNPIAESEQLTGESALDAYYYINVTKNGENYGYVSGAGSRQVGSYAQLTATPFENCEFDGWYIDDVQVSSDPVYRFRVQSDVDIVAEFHTNVTGISLDTDSYGMDIGQSHNTIVTAAFVDDTQQQLTENVFFTSSNPDVATVNSDGVVTALASGQTDITASYLGFEAVASATVEENSVITWSDPVDITYGTALDSTQLNAEASVPGSFVYSPPAGTVLNAGSNQILSVTFTPDDTTYYDTAIASVTINVNKATPIITWSNPADIIYGTALSSTQLDATASVPGSFVYSPPAGTVLNAGSDQILSVTFTPTDDADYNTATANVTINVNSALPVTSPVVIFKDSNGNPISGGAVDYYSGSWQSLGTTDSNGQLTLNIPAGTYSFAMTYAGGRQQISQNIDANPTVIFQTTNVMVQLKNSGGNLIDSGTVQYYAGSWRTFGSGTTSDGLVNMELLPLSYSFAMTYAGGRQQISQNIAANPTVVFQTTNVIVQLKNSTGNLVDSGAVQYYAGSWRTFGSGTTINGEVSAELLPLSYSFAMTYVGGRQQTTQNIAANSVVVFQTVQVQVRLQDHSGNPLDPGTVQYYAGSWRDIGITSGGEISTELLPLSYSFAMTYGGGRQQLTQDVSANPVVVFQTILVRVQLKDHNRDLLDTGSVQYYAGSWRTFGSGNTSSGEVTAELLPLSYSFAMTYGGGRQQITQNIAANSIVVFQTVQVISDSGNCTGYYAGQWRDFVQGTELLPVSYPFKFNDGTSDQTITLTANTVNHIH